MVRTARHRELGWAAQVGKLCVDNFLLREVLNLYIQYGHTQDTVECEAVSGTQSTLSVSNSVTTFPLHNHSAIIDKIKHDVQWSMSSQIHSVGVLHLTPLHVECYL